MKLLCIGAHPDDCEGSVGGTALLCRDRGDEVTFVSVTDGSRGHYFEEYRNKPQRLAQRRAKEMRAVSDATGIGYICMDVPDGEVYVTKTLTEAMIRLIRREQPDLVLLNRPNDYHRDHRYTAQLVLDATYMLTVPLLCPETPALSRMPVFAYWQDSFTEGGPFRPDFTVSIDSVVERKRDMMMLHVSQYLEWLPFNAGVQMPQDAVATRRVVREQLVQRSRNTAARTGAAAEFAEAFQISEYGSRPTSSELVRMFPSA